MANNEKKQEEKDFDYVERARLRAAVFAANDGLLFTTCLMLSVGVVTEDVKSIMQIGVAGLVSGTCGRAFDFSDPSHDIEFFQTEDKEKLSNLASALAFALGAAVPVLAAAFVDTYKRRLGMVVAVVTLTLIGFGGLDAFLLKAPSVKNCILRILIAGWIGMALAVGLAKLVDHVGNFST
ncbi:Vacuolar iron transporter-like 4 [Spatholobus suberectus]|nr:Vacuolar iron transporter-like 4 [Spatholobus suberectus]